MTQQWKLIESIESAPKDGSRVLVWHPDYCAPITAQWYGSEGWKMDNDVSPFWQQPTHWMPLPAAPGTPPASAQDDAKDERQAFETWHKREFGDFVADAPNHYNRWLGWQGHASIAAPAAGDARDAIAEAFRILRAARGSIRAHQLAGPTMLATDSRALTNADDDILRAMKALKPSQQQEG